VTNGKLLNLQDTHAEWALLQRGEFMDPTMGKVLNRREGYMPKIRKGGHFFVKMTNEVSIGGKMRAGKASTVRYFDNHSDAKLWASRQPDSKKMEVVADGELSAAERDMEYTNLSGGLFHGARKQEPIPFGLEEKALTAQRTDALNGLQRYVEHLAKQMPYSLYRMSLRQRWENTARELGAFSGRPMGSFDELSTHLDTKHPAYGFLKDSHDQVSLISGVPTDAEKAARAKSQSIALWLERNISTKAGSKVHGKNLSAEISGAMRGTTFHTLLGMYNPAQYLIQASGALIALSINPVHGAKAIGQSMSFQVLDRLVSKNPHKLDDYLKAMDKMGIDSEGYRLWNKSGLRQSVTSASVDYEGVWANLPYDASMFRKIMANDTYFFKSGELVSARVSFATAYNRAKSMKKGGKITDQDLPDIMARSEQYRLNMTKANSAKFQTGMLSIPTQFQQVNTKFMEKLLGKGEFTTMEKTRMATGQAAMFGAMGVPIGGFMAPVLMDMLGIDAQTLDAEELTVVRNGALSWMFNDFMGIESVITGRMTLGGDFLERIWMAAVEPTKVVDMLAGPSMSLYEKTENMIFNVRTALSADFSAEGMESNKVALVTEILARSAAQFAGGANNLVKAYDMSHSKFYRNRAGKPIFEWGDVNLQTLIGQAAGFSPIEVADFYEVNNRDGGMIPASMTNKDAKRITFIMNMLDNDTPQSSNEMALYAINAINSKYDNPDDRKRLTKQVLQLIKHPKDVWEKNLRKMVQEWDSSLNDGIADMIRMSKARTNPRVAEELEERGAK